ncbi:membrane hypothetical protein [Bradyrhizobium sp. ORS 375]|uniref:hypothetical protein n=1 Tax=Bradyrhizobium sp. (strain ORS 375) TaxID=566679 RepID=UPI000240A16B|nr:hypothetical protein [Bradyrhizobium sp. ORS 375]CCD92256.1 membrane hypothetical protein [Bradyrhizobium sp. ORS 375]
MSHPAPAPAAPANHGDGRAVGRRLAALLSRRGLPLLALVLLLVFGAPGRLTAAGDIPPGAASFAERVRAVDRDAGDMVSYKFLPLIPSFEALADAGLGNVTDCLAALALAGLSDQQRIIAILSLYKLAIADYVIFLRGMVGLRDQNLITAGELGLAVFRRAGFGHGLAESYQDPPLRSVLAEIAARTDVSPNLQAYIAQILSGQALRDQRMFQWECCDGPTPWLDLAKDLAFGAMVALLLVRVRLVRVQGHVRRTVAGMLAASGLLWLALWSGLYPNFYWSVHLALAALGAFLGAQLALSVTVGKRLTRSRARNRINGEAGT